jgi:tRNA A37 threonylcarbamoyladenosine dehydratase
MDTPTHAERFRGIDRLYGAGSVERLSQAHVCVVGIGGVGSWAVEALARSGVGRITLIDADEVCLSNTNRQLHALDGEYGKAKVVVMAERARAINPSIGIDAIAQFLTPSNLANLLDRDHDLVIDACDAFRVKVEMIAWCARNCAKNSISRAARSAISAYRRSTRARTCVIRRQTAASAASARPMAIQ